MITEYTCLDCKLEEYEFAIVPKKKCPNCGMIMNCEEDLDK